MGYINNSHFYKEYIIYYDLLKMAGVHQVISVKTIKFAVSE